MARLSYLAFSVAVMLAVSSGAPTAVSGSLEPDTWDQELRLTEAHDNNPDPKIVEVDLTARVADVTVGEGKTVRAN